MERRRTLSGGPSLSLGDTLREGRLQRLPWRYLFLLGITTLFGISALSAEGPPWWRRGVAALMAAVLLAAVVLCYQLPPPTPF